uniref:Uncharacterized protein n=1 Tax=viral metagenome TaxID=1070528 RepID=A0A6C0EPM8_9ZZZZ
MRVTQTELVIVALLIGYVAFYTHPAPKHLQDFLSTPVGNVIALGGILYVTVYQSLVVGVFLAIAYIMTVNAVTEYMTDKPAPVAQPKSAGVSPPEVNGALKALLKGTNMPSFKGDNRLPQVAQKKGTAPVHSTPPVTPPKGSPPKSVEHFASF